MRGSAPDGSGWALLWGQLALRGAPGQAEGRLQRGGFQLESTHRYLLGLFFSDTAFLFW